jgi:hypothetical protein
MPDWDQWDAEAGELFTPWFENDHFLTHLFTPHNEHRVILTKLQNLALVLLGGQWDSRLEAVTNALRDDRGISLNIGGRDLPIALRAIGPVTAPDDADLGELETYTLTLITGDRRTGTRTPVTNAAGGSPTFRKPLDNDGTKTLPDYPAYVRHFVFNINIPGCSTPGRVFVGQRAEAFAVNLGPVFDLVNFVPVEGDSAPGARDGELDHQRHVVGREPRLRGDAELLAVLGELPAIGRRLGRGAPADAGVRCELGRV